MILLFLVLFFYFDVDGFDLFEDFRIILFEVDNLEEGVCFFCVLYLLFFSVFRFIIIFIFSVFGGRVVKLSIEFVNNKL